MDEPSGRWVKTYPEAPGKITHYSRVVNTLESCYKEINQAINSAINSAKSRITAASPRLESANLSGDYYNEFVNRKNNWVDDAENMIVKFGNFLVNLTSCISQAKAHLGDWQHKDTLWHWESY